MTAQIWGKPEPGVYFTRHAGHELQVKIFPRQKLRDKNERRYGVIVDDILVGMAWTTKDAKTMAIKMAERTHRGYPITPYEQEPLPNGAGRIDATMRAIAALGELPGGIAQADRPAPDLEPTPEPVAQADGHAKPASEPMPAPEPEPVAQVVAPVAVVPVGQQQALEHVVFEMRGELHGLSPADALAALRAAVELIREHGTVTCDATVPRTVAL